MLLPPVDERFLSKKSHTRKQHVQFYARRFCERINDVCRKTGLSYLSEKHSEQAANDAFFHDMRLRLDADPAVPTPSPSSLTAPALEQHSSFHLQFPAPPAPPPAAAAAAAAAVFEPAHALDASTIAIADADNGDDIFDAFIDTSNCAPTPLPEDLMDASSSSPTWSPMQSQTQTQTESQTQLPEYTSTELVGQLLSAFLPTLSPETLAGAFAQAGIQPSPAPTPVVAFNANAIAAPSTTTRGQGRGRGYGRRTRNTRASPSTAAAAATTSATPAETTTAPPGTAVREKPFACAFCLQCFARKHDLQRHERLHTGHKPYECLGCGEVFKRSDARDRHWKKLPDCIARDEDAVKNTEEGKRRERRRVVRIMRNTQKVPVNTIT